MARRLLLIRPGAIGDCVVCFPAMEWLRAEYTEVWISKAVVPLVTFADCAVPLGSTGIDLVGVGDIAIPQALRERLASFDLIVSWYGTNRPEFRAAIEELGVPCKFLSALPPDDFVGYASDFFSGQVSAPARAPRIAPVDGDGGQRNTVVIHPFSGSLRKNWPLRLFRELAERLPFPVEWSAGPEEPLEDAVRFSDLAELARWMRGSRLYIGNDSGITHVAAAVGAKTLAIFGPASRRTWEPRGDGVCVLRCGSLEELGSESVLLEAVRMIGPLPNGSA